MAAIRWSEIGAIPPADAAVLSALDFSRPGGEALGSLTDEQWRRALDFADRSRLTLLLGHFFSARAPGWVRERFTRNYESNSRRLHKLLDEYRGVADALSAQGLEHVLLKGFLQAPRFAPNFRLRAQYDLDLLFLKDEAPRARGVIESLGFESVRGHERVKADHLPPLTRKTGWRWRGDYFDPEIPATVEPHFRLWDEQTERIRVGGLDQFWARRESYGFEDIRIPGLCGVDQPAYAALHAVRHLLRGNLGPNHVWELAYFLDGRREDQAFWNRWLGAHPPESRRMQAIGFRLAELWFAPRAAEVVRVEIDRLPPVVHRWFDGYAASPIVSRYRPCKNELWLHLSLLAGAGDRLRVARRRLLPLRPPPPITAVHDADRPPEATGSPAANILNALNIRSIRDIGAMAAYAAFVFRRLHFHAAALARAGREGFRWWKRNRPSRSAADAEARAR